MVFNVDVKNSFSFFETESKFVDNFLAINSQDVEFNGRKVSLEISHRKMRDGGGSREGVNWDGEKRSGGYNRSGGGYKGGEKRDGGFKRPRSSSSFGGSSEKRSFNRSSDSGSGSGERKRSFGKSKFRD
jgi:ATP-dependent RNA helicase DeaD